jgi:hypothetical protein
MHKKFLRTVTIISLGVFGFTMGSSHKVVAMDPDEIAKLKEKQSAYHAKIKDRDWSLYYKENELSKLEQKDEDHKYSYGHKGSELYEENSSLGQDKNHCYDCNRHDELTKEVKEIKGDDEENCIIM